MGLRRQRRQQQEVGASSFLLDRAAQWERENPDDLRVKVMRMMATPKFREMQAHHAAMVRGGQMDRTLAGCESMFDRLLDWIKDPATTDPDFGSRVLMCRHLAEDFVAQLRSGRFHSDPAEQLGAIAAWLTHLVAEDEIRAATELAKAKAEASA
jgi:hypothetical protein